VPEKRQAYGSKRKSSKRINSSSTVIFSALIPIYHREIF
jgi:hypothetical protein